MWASTCLSWTLRCGAKPAPKYCWSANERRKSLSCCCRFIKYICNTHTDTHTPTQMGFQVGVV